MAVVVISLSLDLLVFFLPVKVNHEDQVFPVFPEVGKPTWPRAAGIHTLRVNRRCFNGSTFTYNYNLHLLFILPKFQGAHSKWTFLWLEKKT